ncbi:hypothetical protein TUM17576_03700 [Enterobacter hormaechei]|nr:hypothetical protein [Enterobacter hormaechei]GJL33550.1 hypothetical protein TUM17576_03700 [Enterobacter hormaechei]
MTAQLPSINEKIYRLANHIAGAKGGLPTEWKDWAEEIETDLRALLAAHEQEPVNANEAEETLQKICNIFRIGIQAQTQSTILTNVENAVRFAKQLHAIEREFFMVPGEPDEDYPDDEPADVCLVNCWGSTTERYVEQFREALARVTHPAPVPAVPDGYVLMPMKLTAENGAKYALSGEFHVLHRVTCHECGGEGCSDCDDEGSFEEKIMIGWDDIKDIYRAAVEACSIKSTGEGV